jgi:hypothetical protein
VTTLSLRRLWTIYKRTAVEQRIGAGKRDLALARVAFYSGARGVLRVMDHMIAEGGIDAARAVIERQGRQIKRIQARHPRARPH